MKMIIYSNENDTSVLKIVISAKLAKKSYEINKPQIVHCSTFGTVNKIVVQISDDMTFFSSNAACLYLLDEENVSPTSDILQWLEWEQLYLSPCINKTFGSAACNDDLSSYLQKINDVLIQSVFICGRKFSVVDACIWSSLFPLFSCNSFNVESLPFIKLIEWYKKVQTIREIEETVAELTPMKTYGNSQYTYVNIKEKAKPKEDENLTKTSSSPEQKQEAVSDEEMHFAAHSWENGKNLLEARLPDEKFILPKEGHKNILITSALPYVNNVPHLGNIIGCVLSADVFARYCRLCNYNTLYVCGTDEYGTATETKALEEGLTPKQICDKYFEIHNSVYRWFGIGFDYFGRTTHPEQTEIVQEMFLSLYKNGFVETQTVGQLLCEKCDRFLADRFVEGICPHPGCAYEDARGDQCDSCGKLINATELINPRCKLCSQTPVLRSSSHFFLNLPQLEPLLQIWVQKNESGWSNTAQQITRAWLKSGLRARCITRDLKWGIPVPIKGFESKVFYVWFDAPLGYISITKRYTNQYEKWWKVNPKYDVRLYQFMAKDNVPFHSVVNPSTLLGVGEKHTMVKHILATEYLNYEDQKFSKSRGIGVFGTDAQDTGIPADVYRFYLISIRPESQDSNFSWMDLATRNNSELLNNFGNFVNRAICLCSNSINGVIPHIELSLEDLNSIALINRELKDYVECMESGKLRDGLKHVLSISRIGNQYMQAQQPWVLLKKNSDIKSVARGKSIIGLACNMSCLLGILIAPVMPQTSRDLLNQLGTILDDVGQINPIQPSFHMLLPPGHKIGKPSLLFVKMETSRMEELQKRYGGKRSPDPSNIEMIKLTSEQLQAKILEQGEIVRKTKTNGADKTVWGPMVDVLLSLKSQLVLALKEEGKENTVSQDTGNKKSRKKK